jgi:hypothetical protein
LVRGEANLTGTFVLGLEVVIVIPNAIENHQEQFSGHPITMMKCLLFKDRINWVKVALVKAWVASFLDRDLHWAGASSMKHPYAATSGSGR